MARKTAARFSSLQAIRKSRGRPIEWAIARRSDESRHQPEGTRAGTSLAFLSVELGLGADNQSQVAVSTRLDVRRFIGNEVSKAIADGLAGRSQLRQNGSRQDRVARRQPENRPSSTGRT